MRIAVFIKRTTHHQGYGGMETQNKILCEGLAQKGHKVTVFAPKWAISKEFITENDVDYVFVASSYRSLAGFAHLSRRNWVNRSVVEFSKLHIETPFDLVLSQSSAGLGIISHKNELNVPVVSISHGSTGGEIKTRFQGIKNFKDFLKLIPDTAYFLLNFFVRQRQFIGHSNKVITVSEAVKTSLINETFIDKSKFEVIYNGIFPPSLADIRRKTQDGIIGKPVILYVGQILKSKGLDDLVKAVASDEFENTKTRIIGGGDFAKKLQKLINSKKLQHRIELVGKIPYEKVLEEMQKASIFVLPSKRVEGFPMTTVEAMFSRLPTVVSDMGGSKEAVIQDETGIIYSSGDIAQLKASLLKLVQNPDLVTNMGDAAYKRALADYTVDTMLTKYEKVFEQVLEKEKNK